MTDTDRETSGRIVVVIDLPQPIDKIARLMETLGTVWPMSTVNAKPRDTTISLNGGSIVEISPE